MRRLVVPAAVVLMTVAVLIPATSARAQVAVLTDQLACPTSPGYVVIDCNVGDATNAKEMFAGSLDRFETGWIAAYMKDWSDGGTEYQTGYTAQNSAPNPFSDNWASKARMWKPNGTDARPELVDPGLVIFGSDVNVATQPAQIFTSHSSTPGVADSFLTPVAMTVCTGDLEAGCLSTEGNGKVSEVSVRPVDVPRKGTIYAVYSFCPHLRCLQRGPGPGDPP